jgi:TonB family protein
MLVKVGDDGSVTEVRVVHSVSPILDEAAVSAARKWKYRPAQFGDRTVAAWVEESVEFKPK